MAADRARDVIADMLWRHPTVVWRDDTVAVADAALDALAAAGLAVVPQSVADLAQHAAWLHADDPGNCSCNSCRLRVGKARAALDRVRATQQEDSR